MTQRSDRGYNDNVRRIFPDYFSLLWLNTQNHGSAVVGNFRKFNTDLCELVQIAIHMLDRPSQ